MSGLGVTKSRQSRKGPACRAVVPETMALMLFVSVLLLPFVILAGCVIWGWTHDTLWESSQEKTDREFEQIVRRLSNPHRRSPPGGVDAAS